MNINTSLSFLKEIILDLKINLLRSMQKKKHCRSSLTFNREFFGRALEMMRHSIRKLNISITWFFSRWAAVKFRDLKKETFFVFFLFI